MTSQEKKEYLKQVYRIEKHVENLVIERKNILTLLEKCTSTTAGYESDGSTSGTHANNAENNIVNYISALQDYESKLRTQITEMLMAKEKLKQIIENVPNYEHRQILYKRYICFQKWEQIAVDMNINMRWVYRLHGQALDNLEIRQ